MRHWVEVDALDMGRGAVAQRSFRAGECVHQETAVALAVEPPHRDDVEGDPIREHTAAIDAAAEKHHVDSTVLRLAARLVLVKHERVERLVAPPLPDYARKAAENVSADVAGLLDVEPAELVASIARANANAFAFAADVDPTFSLGMAIVPQAARLNHSCWPNSAISNHGVVYQIRVLRVVEEGEPLTLPYIGLVDTRAARRAKLLAERGFECACPRCADPTSDLELAIGGVLCEKGGPHHPSAAGAEWRCPACGADEAAVSEIEQQAYHWLRQGRGVYDAAEFDAEVSRAAIEILLEKCDAVLSPLHAVTFQLLAPLVNCCIEMEDHKARLAFVQRMAAIAEVCLPEHSIELAGVHLALADAMMHAFNADPEELMMVADAHALLALRLRAYEVCCGPRHPAAREATKVE